MSSPTNTSTNLAKAALCVAVAVLVVFLFPSPPVLAQVQGPVQAPTQVPAPAPEPEQKIENPIAIFAALDKVTARIKPLSIPIGETARFGALKVTPRVCYTEPPTEPPLTRAFVEVDEIKLDGSENRIFTGWMYAQSPGLHAVEHPVFDVWLTNCRTESGSASADNAKKSADPATASSNRR
jgi:hypothetical protein